MKRLTFNRLIAAANFAELFISEMAWNNPTGPVKLPPIEIDSVTYSPQAVADKCGFKVLVCEVDTIPTTSVCRRIDLKVRRFANDYILIFAQRSGFHHLWLAPVRKVDKRDIVTTEYTTAAQSEFLFEKVDKLAFAFDERVTITDVRQRVQESFVVNSEKITKDFYAGFKKEHKAFVEFISGIEGTDTATKDRQWYASVMLNRLMFCYFIQKKGFLDGNTDYLQDKLRLVQRERGEGHFFRSFYIGFLRGLFHDGLNTPRHDEEFENTYGRIPYLNGGMFDEHKIEHDYAGIDIADEAFERLFNFFDRWNWHLDTRITASGKDINPDVLGYIFEQYINDRAQMGAYYTKEDITEYIGRSCILPYLFDRVKNATAESAKAFAPEGYVWRTLRDSGDRYIFDAVKKGYKDFGQIPENIARGIITEEMNREYSETPISELSDTHIPLATLRSDWNNRTPEPWGLPNEIWRETIDRLQRCDDILGKIRRGEITSINDFITYNLDIRTFARDLLAKASDHLFIKHFYQALKDVTILDPTCGSGAFLFAAMNILEPLYEVCIDRMQEFNEINPKLFKEELIEINDRYRSNIQYFIYKSIILRNLYGVDIMVEATEIAKLRLFLKMVAVVDVERRAENLGLDPLPDIDFNIRCGNTLVGYANKEQLDHDLGHAEDILQELANQDFKQQIEDEVLKVAAAYRIFVYQQLRQEEDMMAFKQAKHNLRELLKSLNDKLNHRLYSATSPNISYDEWLKSHQPFNWLAEFYQIIEGNGGFDVIIGNPPYVEYTRKNKESGKCIRDIYKLNGYATINCSNLYAFVIERSCIISKNRDNIGFIVPLSLASNNNMADLRDYICAKGTSWYSHYEVRPAKLFDGAEQRLTIFFIRDTNIKALYSTAIQRWNNEHRNTLFNRLAYAPSFNNGSIWRTSSDIETSIYSKFNTHKPSAYQLKKVGSELHYRTAGVRYWIIFLNKGFGTESLSNKVAFFENNEVAKYYMAAFNSNLFWWYYALNFDMFNLKDYMIFNFKLDYIPNMGVEDIAVILESDLENHKVHQEINSKTRGQVTTSYYQKKQSKVIIDTIDCILAKIFRFTDEELDFIINYDIKYRMGDELNNSDE